MSSRLKCGRCCAGNLCQFISSELNRDLICTFCKKIVHAQCRDKFWQQDGIICLKCATLQDHQEGIQQETPQKTLTRTAAASVSKMTRSAAAYVASFSVFSGATSQGKNNDHDHDEDQEFFPVPDSNSATNTDPESDAESTTPKVVPVAKVITVAHCKACGGTDHRRKNSAKCPLYRKKKANMLLEQGMLRRVEIANEELTKEKTEDAEEEKENEGDADSKPSYINLGGVIMSLLLMSLIQIFALFQQCLR